MATAAPATRDTVTSNSTNLSQQQGVTFDEHGKKLAFNNPCLTCIENKF